MLRRTSLSLHGRLFFQPRLCAILHPAFSPDPRSLDFFPVPPTAFGFGILRMSGPSVDPLLFRRSLFFGRPSRVDPLRPSSDGSDFLRRLPLSFVWLFPWHLSWICVYRFSRGLPRHAVVSTIFFSILQCGGLFFRARRPRIFFILARLVLGSLLCFSF